MNKFDDCIDDDNCVDYIDDCVDSSSSFDMSDPRTFSDPDKNAPIKYTYAITFSHDSELSIWFKPNNLKSKFVQLKNENEIVPVQTNFESVETIRNSQYHGYIAIFVDSNENYSVPDEPSDYRGSSWINYHFAEILNSFVKRKVSVIELLKLEHRIQQLERNR